MTFEIAFLLVLLVAMVYCFMTEVLPVELTAFIGLIVLVFTGYVEVDDAFTGFSSPAVMTMFSIFFISAALLETGVADWIGARIHKLVGGREVPLIVLIMVVAGVLSAFMNNVAAAAVLLPAIAALARKSNIAPSRLFMPLSFGAILGGTTTLVGTPPNILAAEMLAKSGHEPFSLFDFAPMGLALLGVGILFMATVGRRLLPAGSPDKAAAQASHLSTAYRLEERLTSIHVPRGSVMEGQTVRETRLGSTLDVQVVAVERGGSKHLAPGPDFQLQGDDRLLVDGRYEDLQELMRVQGLAVEEANPEHLDRAFATIRGAVLRLRQGSGLIGRSLAELRFRHRFGVLVVGVKRNEELLQRKLGQVVLEVEDRLLVLGLPEELATLFDQRAFEVETSGVPARQLVQERLYMMQVGPSSDLAGKTLGESRIGELVGLTVLGMLRDTDTLLAPTPSQTLQSGDELVVSGAPDRLLDLLRLGDLELSSGGTRAGLESDEVGVAEAVVAPRSRLEGATLKSLHFRDRFGLQVLALWRSGQPLHRDLANLPLRVGDALLLHGNHNKLQQLAEDEEFVVLSLPAAAPRRSHKAPVALGALALMITLVATGLYPIHVAAFAGAVVAVLFGALTMDQAYRAIEWRALFLVAAILPVGGAMEASGAAGFLANSVVSIAGDYGPYAFLTALAVLSSLLSQGLDGAPTVVILAPVVVLTAEQLGVSPYPLMMVVGLAASAAFMTPFSHKANLLVMSAGGYRAMDYVKVGTPLTLIVLVILVLMTPLFFPL